MEMLAHGLCSGFMAAICGGGAYGCWSLARERKSADASQSVVVGFFYVFAAALALLAVYAGLVTLVYAFGSILSLAR